jgi:mannose-P-dolichol utilization defect protein 1
MVALIDIPFVLPLAEWIWGSGSSGLLSDQGVSATICLSQIPFISAGCFSQLLTKALGVAIILGSCLNKVPIMVNMMNSQSAAGISRNSLYGEGIVYCNGALYGYLEGHPFTAYGENASLLVQNMILVAMTWNFMNKTTIPITFQEQVLVIIGFLIYLLSVLNFLPDHYRYLLMSTTWPVMLYARGSQVYETFSVKHTGNLSIVTTSMNLVGSLIRILTTLKETGDMVVLSGYLLSGSLSFIMFVQYWLYLSRTTEVANEMERSKVSNKTKKLS